MLRVRGQDAPEKILDEELVCVLGGGLQAEGPQLGFSYVCGTGKRAYGPKVGPLEPAEGQCVGEIVADLVGRHKQDLRLQRILGAKGGQLGEVIWEHRKFEERKNATHLRS